MSVVEMAPYIYSGSNLCRNNNMSENKKNEGVFSDEGKIQATEEGLILSSLAWNENDMMMMWVAVMMRGKMSRVVCGGNDKVDVFISSGFNTTIFFFFYVHIFVISRLLVISSVILSHPHVSFSLFLMQCPYPTPVHPNTRTRTRQNETRFLFGSFVLQFPTCLKFFPLIVRSFCFLFLLVVYISFSSLLLLFTHPFPPLSLFHQHIPLSALSLSLPLPFTCFHLVLSSVPNERDLLCFPSWVKCCVLFCSNEENCLLFIYILLKEIVSNYTCIE